MMRTILISLAAAASALAVATPASAQWAPPPQPYGYGAPAHGYGFGHVRALQARIDGIQRQIRFLDRRNILSNREARRLRDDSVSIERRLHRAARYGLNPYEARDIEVRIARLEQRVHREAMDRDRRWGRHAGYWGDRDFDRNDRRDRDDRDGRWDRDDDDD